MRRIHFALVIEFEARSIDGDDVEQAIMLALGERSAIAKVTAQPVGRRLYNDLADVPATNAAEDFVALARWHLGQLSDEEYAEHLLDIDDPIAEIIARRMRVARQLDEPWEDPARTGARAARDAEREREDG